MDIIESDWDEMRSLNLKGTFFRAQAAARHMLHQGLVRIININSQTAVIAIDGEAVYCAPVAVSTSLLRCYPWNGQSAG